MTKPYAIGLDIGTNSVGWSVVTEGYKVPAKVMKVLGNTDRKSIKKNLLGVLIFDEGQTAADYRINRITSRRYERRRNRILYLQEIFAEEMAKLDPYFFARLQESFYVQSDKEYAPQPIFAKFEEESAYHQAYPTIYHLRKELADVQEKKDIRLVYLALAHILKYRGHFLFESTEEFEHADIQETFQEFLQEYNEQFEACLKVQDVHTILTASLPKALKVDKVRDLFAGETSKGSLNHFLKLMLGYKVDFKKLFGLEESLSLQFSKDEYEEDLEALLGKVGTEYEDIFLISKRLYDAILLSGILTITDPSSKAPLSSSMVKRYKEHAEDLKSLKVWFRKYAPEQYRSMFNDKTQKGYAAYIGGLYKEDKTKGLVATSKAVSEEEFYNFTKSCLQGLPETEVFLEKIAREQFLRKQRTFDNGVIPYQIHLKELRAILKRQAVYYPFLKEAAEQIEKILTFRIPYYVGPLAKGNSRFAWLERKSDQPIRPWNFEELVDMEKSAERFIENLISKDFYLPNEYVLPANSLIYQQYLIFNELTRVYFVPEGGKRTYFSASQKEQIFNDLFKKHRKVTRKKLLDFIAYELGYGDSVGDNLEGIKDEFLSSYRTYYDLEKILGRTFLDDKDNTEILEEIIHILTVFEDRQMIEKGLQKFDTILKPAILKKLARKRYTGWGNVSRRLIDGIRNRETNKTILDYLKDDGYGNRNFMQLI